MQALFRLKKWFLCSTFTVCKMHCLRCMEWLLRSRGFFHLRMSVWKRGQREWYLWCVNRSATLLQVHSFLMALALSVRPKIEGNLCSYICTLNDSEAVFQFDKGLRETTSNQKWCGIKSYFWGPLGRRKLCGFAIVLFLVLAHIFPFWNGKGKIKWVNAFSCG